MCKPIMIQLVCLQRRLLGNTINSIAEETELPKTRVLILVDQCASEMLNIPFQHIDLHILYARRKYLLAKIRHSKLLANRKPIYI